MSVYGVSILLLHTPTFSSTAMTETGQFLTVDEIAEQIELVRNSTVGRLRKSFGNDIVEDSVGLAIIKILANPTLYDVNKSKFTTWFGKVVLNYCLMELRRKDKPQIRLDEHGPYSGADEESKHHEHLINKFGRLEEYLLEDPVNDYYDASSESKLVERVKHLMVDIEDHEILFDTEQTLRAKAVKMNCSFEKVRRRKINAEEQIQSWMRYGDDRELVMEWKNMAAKV